MTKEKTDVLNIEEKAAQKKSQAALNALNYIFSGKENGLIDSILNDYTPVTKIINGQEVTKAPGLSARSVFRAIGFAIRHPRHIGSLYSLYSSPEIAQTPLFQEQLLRSDNTWGFVEYVGTRLPQIGKVLDYFQFPECAEGNILDNKGLETLSVVLTNQENRNQLKQIAIESRQTPPDTTKIINNILDLMQTSGFANYMSSKREILQNYIVKSLQDRAAQLDDYGLKPENF